MKILKYFLYLLPFIPLFIWRDFTPNNELKYLSIANEAIRDGHLFTFWNHGVVYADKPPLYFWLIMGEKVLFGEHYMWLLSLFSMVPALITLYVMDKWVAHELPQKLRVCGQLMLLTSGLFLGAAVVLRMDMLMCLFIVLSLYVFYIIYKGDKHLKYRIALPIFIFLAIFTKGPIGFIVPIASIIAFLGIKKELRHIGKYLGTTTWGILLFLSCLWFGAVYLEGGKSYLNNLLFHQTLDRAVAATQHNKPIYYYFVIIWQSLAPWVLFYVLSIVIGVRNRRIDTDIKKLFLAIIITTFVLLSLFSSKLDIYLLPAFPFIAYLALLLLPDMKKWYINFTIALPAAIFTIIFPAFLIFQDKVPFTTSPIMYATAALLSVTGIVTLAFLYRTKSYKAINSLAIGLLVSVFCGAFAIPSLNPYIGLRSLTEKAQHYGRLADIDDYRFYSLRSGENLDVYLHHEIKKVSEEDIISPTKDKNYILFLKNKDVQRDNNLEKIVNTSKHYYVGDYCFVILK